MNVLAKLSGLIIVGILHFISTGGIAGAEGSSSDNKSQSAIDLTKLESIATKVAGRYLKLTTVKDGSVDQKQKEISDEKKQKDDVEYERKRCRVATRIGLLAAVESEPEDINETQIKDLENLITKAIQEKFKCPQTQ